MNKQLFRNCYGASFAAVVAVLACAGPTLAGNVINDVNTDKARYAPGSAVTVYVDITNRTGNTITNGTVTLYCKHLATTLATLPSQTFTVSSNASTTLTFTWTPPNTDFQGYSVEVWARNSGGSILDNVNTAVDVSSTWTKFPRYGYMSWFPSQLSSTSAHAVWQLKNYHIDGLQFYDWQWKHHVPLAGTVSNPASSWTDLSNRTDYRQTILDMINAGHGYNMSAMNYNLMYGAWSGYGQDGSGVNYQWGLFNSNNGSNQWALGMPSSWATPYLFVFDPSNTSWQNYIYGRAQDVFAAYPFDGWHIDEVGNPSNTVYNYAGSSVDVWTTFRGFINNAKSTLKKTTVFNNVGGYGMYDVCANSTEDFVYVECWPSSGQNTYNDLKTIVDNGISWSGGKGVVLPAYMDYNYAQSHTGNFNTPGVLLADAAIMASGGSHLELGDGAAMLDNEYFPNHNLTPSSSLLATLQNYYDFDVAYENLLRGNFTNSGNTLWTSVPSSNNASPNTVWAFTKTSGTTHMLNFINLMGEGSNSWRDDNANYPTPATQSNITVKYYYGGGNISGLYWASPDANNGKSYSLSYSVGSDSGGTYVQFTLPSLAYWDMVYLTQ